MSTPQEAVALARAKMEQVENAHFFHGTATMEEVDEARDEYIEAWEARRDAALEEKALERKEQGQ